MRDFSEPVSAITRSPWCLGRRWLSREILLWRTNRPKGTVKGKEVPFLRRPKVVPRKIECFPKKKGRQNKDSVVEKRLCFSFESDPKPELVFGKWMCVGF